MTTAQKLTRARVQLLLAQPFFGTLSLRGQFIDMLFCPLGQAHSLREICGGRAAAEIDRLEYDL